jgi:cytochrome bd-type quinol oxidase subunit 1
MPEIITAAGPGCPWPASIMLQPGASLCSAPSWYVTAVHVIGSPYTGMPVVLLALAALRLTSERDRESGSPWAERIALSVPILALAFTSAKVNGTVTAAYVLFELAVTVIVLAGQRRRHGQAQAATLIQPASS